MTTEHQVKFDSPVYYHITLKGKLYTDLFELINAEEYQQIYDPEKRITSLKVYVKDQAQLSGILNAIYNMHCSLLSVECDNNY